jgi:hypothetical protein
MVVVVTVVILESAVAVVAVKDVVVTQLIAAHDKTGFKRFF